MQKTEIGIGNSSYLGTIETGLATAVIKTGKVFRDADLFLKVFAVVSSSLCIVREFAPAKTARLGKFETSIGEADTHYAFEWLLLPGDVIGLFNRPKKLQLIDKLISVNWIVVGVATTSFYLNEFKIMDTAKLALRVGRFPAMGWIGRQNLLFWIVGLCAVGHAAGYYKASTAPIRVIGKTGGRQVNSRAPVESQELRRRKILSAAETIFQVASFLNLTGLARIPTPCLHLCKIAAKGFGVYDGYQKIKI